MRYIIMHKTNAQWEAGAVPSPELIASVGRMLGELESKGQLLAGEGLRASSLGVRLQVRGGEKQLVAGPFVGSNELPGGFFIVRTTSLEEATAWASRFADILGDIEIDIRPVTEAWDIGVIPKPEGLTTYRYMILYKASARSEAGLPLSNAQASALARFKDDMTRAGVLLAAEGLAPSAKGKRLRMLAGQARPVVLDGPFTESKELIAGYVIVKTTGLAEAAQVAERYCEAVGCHEVDVREVL